jgi:hypothetical protein
MDTFTAEILKSILVKLEMLNLSTKDLVKFEKALEKEQEK